jgi:apolipoprotein D and lipocalin family protein
MLGLSVHAGTPNYLAESVRDFRLESYLGTWYELARMDHRFERGMSHVTATYSMKSNGKVKVLNKGYVKSKSKWKSASGFAKFMETPDVGALKVTFFWPFFGGYHIVELADDYSYALIAGDSNKYLWILSRTPTLPEQVYTKLLTRARNLGFNTDELIFVDQASTPENP